jgi:hypothetical protein
MGSVTGGSAKMRQILPSFLPEFLGEAAKLKGEQERVGASYALFVEVLLAQQARVGCNHDSLGDPHSLWLRGFGR